MTLGHADPGQATYLVDADPILVIHLVELINQADTLVSQHQSTSLQCPLSSDGVLLD